MDWKCPTIFLLFHIGMIWDLKWCCSKLMKPQKCIWNGDSHVFRTKDRQQLWSHPVSPIFTILRTRVSMEVMSLSFHGGSLLAGGYDQDLVIWDAESSLPGIGERCRSCFFFCWFGIRNLWKRCEFMCEGAKIPGVLSSFCEISLVSVAFFVVCSENEWNGILGKVLLT